MKKDNKFSVHLGGFSAPFKQPNVIDGIIDQTMQRDSMIRMAERIKKEKKEKEKANKIEQLNKINALVWEGLEKQTIEKNGFKPYVLHDDSRGNRLELLHKYGHNTGQIALISLTFRDKSKEKLLITRVGGRIYLPCTIIYWKNVKYISFHRVVVEQCSVQQCIIVDEDNVYKVPCGYIRSHMRCDDLERTHEDTAMILAELLYRFKIQNK